MFISYPAVGEGVQLDWTCGHSGHAISD